MDREPASAHLTRLTASLADRYRIERELGQGGMATVYLAHDIRHDRRVALKVLRPELSAILGAERFLAEIKTTANLQHPHILSLFDSGEADGLVFYVMPYVDGESLRERLQREHQLPIDEAVRIGCEVADALEYAHRHGIVHRDIKPENILLHGGHAQVADFGIALAAARSEGGSRMTETGMSLGTPHYMAPEQAMGEREITPRVDIYALGCVVYEMLTAEPPFVGATAQAIVARVMTEEPRSLTLQRKTIPVHVEAAVHTALAKLPADRFSSAAQFGAALSGQAPVASVTRAATASVPGRRVLRPMVILPWVVAAVGVALATWATLRPAPASLVERFGLTVSDSASIRIDHPNHAIALSPDGRRIVYTGLGPRGSRVLYLRETGQLVPRLLAGTESAEDPVFSPNGEWVAFNNSSKIMKVAVAGGPPLSVADLSGARGLAWGDDDRIIFAHSNSGLMRVSAAGGAVDTIVPLAAAPGANSVRRPAVLPGSQAVLFTAQVTGGTRVGVADLKSGQITWLLNEAFDARVVPTGHLVYASAAGALVAVRFDPGSLRMTGSPVSLLEGLLVNPTAAAAQFAVSESGRLLYLTGGIGPRSLVLVEPGGSERVVAEALGLAGPRFSPDGRYIALATADGRAIDVQVVDLGGGTMSPLTFGGVNQYPEWTPDGRRVAFSSSRAGADGFDLYWTPADGSGEPVPLVGGPGPQFEVQFTPDQRTLAVREADSFGTRGFFVVPMDSPSVRRPWLATRFSERSPALSPDGRWLAYASDESGTDEVYVRAFPVPLGRWKISGTGGVEPRWAPNGREVLYRSADSVIRVGVTTQPSFVVGRRAPLFARPYHLDPQHAQWDVSPDGRRYAFIRVTGEASGLVLTLNWFEELRTRVR